MNINMNFRLLYNYPNFNKYTDEEKIEFFNERLNLLRLTANLNAISKQLQISMDALNLYRTKKRPPKRLLIYLFLLTENLAFYWQKNMLPLLEKPNNKIKNELIRNVKIAYKYAIDKLQKKFTFITYKELGETIGLTNYGNHFAFTMGRIGAIISLFEYYCFQAPLLSAIFVSTKTGETGEGFYNLAKTLKLLDNNTNKKKFWLKQIELIKKTNYNNRVIII